MIGAFFGTVIALERAVALDRRWGYLAPLAAGIGGLCIAADASVVARVLLIAASVVLLAATATIFVRQRAMFTATLALGALAWVCANALYAAGARADAVAIAALAFVILTIAAERLELSRLLPPSRLAHRVFAAIVLAIGLSIVGAGAAWGPPLFGLALVALALWLAKQDVARRTVRGKALTRYIAICLLAGYAWLAVGGAIALAGGFAPGSRGYDAALHALALGFVFSMVLGHAPIIVPAVLRVDIPYRRWFYLPLVLLHATLALRVAGDALGDASWIRAGGVGNAIALVAFVAAMALAAASGRNAVDRAAVLK
jgi:hypothetical protein